jgi:type IV secretion system protein VirB1
MMLLAVALAALMVRCATNVAPSTMAAIVRVESGGDPLAIGDNTARRSYHPANRASAEALARRLLDAGHSLDLGLAQIDSVHFTGFDLNVHTIFDACTNLNAGARILSDDYGFAARRYGSGQVALRHAIGMYNTGQLNAGESYVRRVLAAAGIQERHALGWPMVAASDAGQSTLLVHVRIMGKKSPSTRDRVVTPSRAPILITITQPPGITVF